MGGFAVAIEWDDKIDSDGFDSMCALMSHRATAGLRSVRGRGSALAEARLPRDGVDGWQLETLGSFTIVGDVRLWNTTRLVAMAGSTPYTAPTDDRHLLLSAYRRQGLAMMDAVDGDFAFVIWDEADRVVVAARDRFGVKPLFIDRTETGIRFASEPKQLIAYTGNDPSPSIAAAAQHLSGRFFLDGTSSFKGIDRLLPAHALIATDRSVRDHRYWDLQSTRTASLTANTVHDVMRDHLVDSVERRLASSQRAVAHLSGGLDSASITASAHLLTSEGLNADRLYSVSAVFPGRAEDESHWIADVVDSQPFGHTDFEPRDVSIEILAHDMQRVDAPIAATLRDIMARPGEIGRDIGADLLLTGNGGDEVTGDLWLLSDMLRAGGWRQWSKGLNMVRQESLLFAIDRAGRSLRLSAPNRLKAPVRSMRRRRTFESAVLLTPLLATSLGHLITENPTPTIRSGTDAMAWSLPNAVLLQVLEAQEAQLAEYGMEISHPFLDRTLVEFVAGIDPRIHPIMLRDKSLLRSAFRGVLPDSLLDRRGKTHTAAFIESARALCAPQFRAKFATIPVFAEGFVDSAAYEAIITFDQDSSTSTDSSGNLWKAWSFLLWFEGLIADEEDKVSTSDVPPYS